MTHLSEELRDWYDRAHEVAYLDLSVELLRGALDAASGDTITRAQVELATALFFRHARTGDLADLDRTIELERHALAATESTDPPEPRRRRLTNLFISHRVRYERLGSPEDLDEAVRLGTEAVSGGAEGIALTHLGMAFLQRYQRTFETADFDRALQLTTRAVAACPPAAPDADRAAALSHLARVLIARLHERFDPVELDRVIDLARQAVAACPESHPDHVRHRGDLAYGLLGRYRHAGAPDDLEESIRILESTLAVAPVTHPSRRAHLAMLAERLIQRPDPGTEDLDRAVSLARRSASLPGEDALAARSWRWLGDALRRRHADRGDPSDLQEAIECWQHATALSTATFTDRIESATSWGAVAAFLGEMTSAAEGYERAVLLLPRLAWHGLPRTAREKHLLDWPGLAPTAAACHILAGAPRRAVEILEQGRTIIQEQLLHTRGDLSRLAERDPVLADRLLRTRERLDALNLPPGTEAAEGAEGHPLAPLGRERQAQERAALCREWDEGLAEARRLEGFEHFLAPVPYAELSAAADGGPVVVLNVSHIACHALVIRPAEPVEVVELPGVTTDALARQAQTFLNVLIARRRGNQSFLRRERDRHAVHDVLEWLWEHVARPVLDRLGFVGRDGAPLPRLWWCPTGLLALLPLHAAGRYPRHRTARQEGRESVPDRVVCSYTSTLTALRRAREGAVGGAFRGLLTVGMPETPGRSALPGVERECGRLRTHVPAATAASDLLGEKATCEAVRRGLHEHSWAHFACHAEQDLMDPALSAFLLYDGRLTAAELLGLRLPSAELAYLSACETAAGGVNLPDEVLHLASTLRSAGYRHVVATMWSIQDGSAPDVAADFYSALTRAGRPNADGAARALHEAVTAHRSQDPTDPLRWAAFLHAGP
ncbi:CHAT domain-containing protein [Streptomyces sp. LX-29]|uniref:CHAT domain-containing protein n=1 Tax=Streptomyces sp. LX-29 TaxID=2900152 RepID=UPI00240D1C5F|nr:CHAT domain-containing protein [Streptomyces sp. LX-29]WFB05822.1 CHAT domain-containing protein [Streptomyces sp. LX-29]